MESRRDGKTADLQQSPSPSQAISQSASAPAQNPFQITAPSISLPKGGGAIRGMGEKFAANPVTGTGSMSVPIATSPGRSGFGPQLALSYDSGAGNGPYGLGWNLALPAITRKTEKGLPKYQDVIESDVFILSGAEDLVPVLTQTAGGQWIPEVIPSRIVNSIIYRIQRYRPRIEGLFARIEHWTNQADPQDSFWRSISRDNIKTWYGKTSESRLADPADPTRIFSWLICESYDDKGNVISYQYKEENSDDVDLSQAHEHNRTVNTRQANRYLKHIRYGNHAPYLPQLTENAPWPTLPSDTDWYFEVVFDYGEHDADTPTPSREIAPWPRRNDPFSTYRAGFEIRTYRLCQRVLMFHHFPSETEVGANCLVRSTDFTYSYEGNPADVRNPIFSTLLSVSQSGYKRQGSGYLKKSLPPVEFQYTQPIIDGTIHDVDPESLENLPAGLEGGGYQWIDLDGEGLSGILTEQAEGWFYKRNLSPVNLVQQNGDSTAVAKFAPIELVATKPNTAIAGGQAQFMDLAGDGQPDLVLLDSPTPGFYEHDEGTSWNRFRPFTSQLNRDTGDPNLKFVDLDGDGHADVLITEDEAFAWHPSLAQEGFGPAQRVSKARDEEQGPALVFADGTQSIYLADLSGDGLTDLVRIRNGEVCYWPNLGYGRFGAKVTMDNAPWFDHPDQFDQRRLHLADIDGSGLTDILYLHGDGVRLYFNQSGNSWSQPSIVPAFPRIDNLATVTVVDLLGNGTACLVWSSPLPGNGRRPMRYVDLMGGHKPHLLVKTINNLGAETRVRYASSTKFYLADKLGGTPWITKLPFPVHCVEKVTVIDKWRQTTFSTTYSYHHGCFDGVEREFRGFGRVDQLDVESYGEFLQGNSASPYITDDKTLYQPPVKTVTWYHTGAVIERERLLSQFAREYFPRWFEDLHPEVLNILGDFQENVLPEPDLDAEDLNAEEWREAFRACKGMMLRQEVYELDVDALERGEHRPVKLFSTAYHNCHIRRLQAKELNRYAVFLVAESEAITYHYELDLQPESLRPDPRIAHTLNLQFDEYANVLQSVAVVYPRLGQFEDNTLQADALTLIHRVQQETHLAYTETRYTHDVADPADPDNYRLRVPCEVLTYELTGISPEDVHDRLSSDPRDNRYFTLDELRRFRLSLVHQAVGEAVPELAYHELANETTSEKRLVEHVRMLFFDDNSPALKDPLPLGQLGRLGLPYETYKLALTEDLLSSVFGAKLTPDVSSQLGDATASGYLSGGTLSDRFPEAETDGQYWIRSGIVGFATDAAQHFYLPERYTDPFGNVTTLEYDPLDLFVASSTDAVGNTTRVTRFDFRVLSPSEMQDINDNRSEVLFDVLGLPAAMAVKGKGNEGDSLTGFDDALANPELAELTAFFTAPKYDETPASPARRWLGNATGRHVYYFGETANADGSITWGTHPSCTCGILRETHVSQLTPDERSLLQAALEYSDGLGSVVVKKVQAEPEEAGQPLRWIASGKTILNNKGKPVKQYEPYFSSSGHRFEEPIEEGVTPVMYYDAVGRTVRTEMPDGSFSMVEFSPWHVRTFDQNDTVRDSQWYTERNPPDPDHPLPRDVITGEFLVTPDQRAAWLAAQHYATPALILLDSLGREVISIARNRVRNATDGLIDEKYLTSTKLDTEGKPLWVRDARKNLVMQYITPPVPDNQPDDTIVEFTPCYDIAGNLLFQHSMDAGDRWMLNDAAGEPMLAWNSRGYRFRTEYDRLHRSVRSFVQGGNPTDPHSEFFPVEILVGRTVYGEQYPEAKARNLRGGAFLQLDQAGVITSEQHDFKGNLLRSSRQLAREYKKAVAWNVVETQLPTDVLATLNLASFQSALAPFLETETFTNSTSFDALNRPIQIIAPHSDRPGTKLNVVRPGYNEANLLERVDVWLQQVSEPIEPLPIDTATQHIIRDIDYNAKGQRMRIHYGNGVSTTYQYDPLTFRLVHLLTDRGTGFADDWPQPPDPPRGGVQNLTYFYDPVGNITRIRDAAQHTIFFNGQRVEPSADYEYDAMYRLIAATGREHIGQHASPQVNHDDSPRMNQPLPTDSLAMRNYTEKYHYDPVGNILRMIHEADPQGSWTRRYDYEATNNRLRATSLFDDAEDEFSAKYAYDPHGSMTRMPHLGGGLPGPNMHWDYKDYLRQTDLGGGGTAFYVYEASGQRVRKVWEKAPGLTEERIYLGGFEIFRKHNGPIGANTATLERETLHVMDDRQRIALVETRTHGDDDSPSQLVRYQFGNHLGSASVELDGHAQIISYEEFYPYGSTSYQAVNASIKTPAKRYRYTGMERDEETGFSYHKQRCYIPWLARWLSSDPIGIGDGPNTYSYTQNRPTALSDPDGTDSRGRFGGIGTCSKEDITTYFPLTSLTPEQTAEWGRKTADWEKAENQPRTRTDQYGRMIGTWSDKEGRAATKRELGKFQDPQRLLNTAKATAMVAFPEYYFLSSSIYHSGRSIYHSAHGESDKAVSDLLSAATDLGGALVGRYFGRAAKTEAANATDELAATVKRTLSRNERGPVVATASSKEAGFSSKLNQAEHEELPLLLQERVNASDALSAGSPDEILNWQMTPGTAGARFNHADVHAVGAQWRAIEEKLSRSITLEEARKMITIDVVSTHTLSGVSLCSRCSFILQGFKTTPRVQKALEEQMLRLWNGLYPKGKPI